MRLKHINKHVRFFHLIILCFFLTGLSFGDAWKLVWSDEFNSNQIDRTKWNFALGGIGFGNNELEYYTDRPQNASVENGSLIIKAVKEPYMSCSYTSAKMTTQRKAFWTYGRFEIRAKLPSGKGIWPAFWLMPEDWESPNSEYGGWPSCGEADIMELIGSDPSTVFGTLHYGVPWTHTGGSNTLPAGMSFSDDYHIFALEWEPGEFRWYVDGRLYLTQNSWFGRRETEAYEYTYPAPFDRDFFLQLNLAVGGNWPGSPGSNTRFPQTLAIDYVRVYRKDNYPPLKERKAPVITESVVPLRPALPDGNLIYNGNFDETNIKEYPLYSVVEDSMISDTAANGYWQFLTGFAGEGTFSINKGEFRAGIKLPGRESYSIQLVQIPILLEKEAAYKLSFDARGEKPRTIMVKLTEIGGSWTAYSGLKFFNLTTKMENYSFVFTMKGETDKRARLEFNMGLDLSSVYLDNISFTKINSAKLEKTPLPDGNYIYNGTFDQGSNRMVEWHLTADGGASAEASVGSEIQERNAKITIKDPGKEASSIMFYQEGLRIEKGKSYIVRFSARSSEKRSIQAGLTGSGNDPRSYYNQTVILSPDMEIYALEFKMKQETDKNARLVFRLGKENPQVIIDDVSMFVK